MHKTLVFRLQFQLVSLQVQAAYWILPATWPEVRPDTCVVPKAPTCVVVSTPTCVVVNAATWRALAGQVTRYLDSCASAGLLAADHAGGGFLFDEFHVSGVEGVLVCRHAVGGKDQRDAHGEGGGGEEFGGWVFHRFGCGLVGWMMLFHPVSRWGTCAAFTMG